MSVQCLCFVCLCTCVHDSCVSVAPGWFESRRNVHALPPSQPSSDCPLKQEVESDPYLPSVMQDTAGAVPFVPGTPAGSPLRQGFSAATALDLAPGTASRATDGQAVGSTPMQQQRGDDSAKAGPSQGDQSSVPFPPPLPPFPTSHPLSPPSSPSPVSSCAHCL